MTEIFVSHATADKAVAKLLVSFMKEAIGVPAKSIFCSSLKGHGIPFAEDFNAYMKEQIQNPKLVILLMTESYLESPFCLMELGAAWAKSLKSLPVVVAPVSYEMVTKTLGLKQAWNLSDQAGLVDLRKLISDHVVTEPRDEHTWDQKRAQWRIDLRKAMKELASGTKVSAADHASSLQVNAEQAKEIETLGSMLDEANARIGMLETAKDATAVRLIKKQFAGAAGLEQEFEELLAAVVKARPAHASNTVFKHIIMDHFGKAPTINWFADRDDFEQAIQYSLMSADEPHNVEWDKAKLKKLAKAIDGVVGFLQSEEGQQFIENQDEGLPEEPDDREFWEYHLSI